MIVFGWRARGEPGWTGLLHCQGCDQWAMQYAYRVKRWFTLFFIPVVPLWSDWKIVCGNCGSEVGVGAHQYFEFQEQGEFLYGLAVLEGEDPEAYRRAMATLSGTRAELAEAAVGERSYRGQASPLPARLWVSKGGASVFDRPDLSGERILRLAGDQEVRALASAGDFWQVELGGAASGFVRAEDVTPVYDR